MAYYPHNIHFRWHAATMDGRGTLAVDSARKVASQIPDAALRRFHSWRDQGRALLRVDTLPVDGTRCCGSRRPLPTICTSPAPGTTRAASPSLARDRWLTPRRPSRRSSASVATRRWPIASFRRIRRPPSSRLPPRCSAENRGSPQGVRQGHRTARAGRAPRRRPRVHGACRVHYPPRHALGAVLLEAGRPAEAETV